jgi:uncharacterized protein (TIGR00730 family)
MKQMKIRNICVYCGSGAGKNPLFVKAARTLGKAMAENGIGLVYGGGGNGLMGEVAKSVRADGGTVTGIIPAALVARENPYTEVDEYVVVDNLHQRKMLMFERSDAFVALPGGLGTLEEVVEQLTWVQLGFHEKPVILANIAHYWDKLLQLLDQMRAETFIREGLLPRYMVVEKAEEIVPMLTRLPAPGPDMPDISIEQLA